MLERISQAASRAIFGREVRGVVREVFVDPNSSYVHMLIGTPQGDQHIIHRRYEIGLNLRTGQAEVHDFTQVEPGDAYSEYVRGKGVVFYPWRKINTNPFTPKKT